MNKKPKGRTLAEFQPLRPAEQKLLAACGEGAVADIGTELPTERTADNVVRAAFLRLLSLGGGEEVPIHEHGIQLRGAWIEGVLDLEGVNIPFRWSCTRTRFEQTPQCMRAEFGGLINLSGSFLPGWQADGLKAKGGIFLRNGFKAAGEVRLLGARIDGDLDCAQAELDGKDGDALSMDRAQIEGSVFLHQGFKATGKVRLLGARIDGSLDCSQAELDGRADDALTAEHARISGAFMFRRLKEPVRGVNLTAAFAGSLVDDAASWGEGLVLDGFSYERLAGDAPTDAKTRLAWLDKQRLAHSGKNGGDSDFRPAPWRQLQKVLREMGHVEDARQVAITLEDRLRHAGLIGQAPRHWNRVRRWSYAHAARGFHWLFKALIGYGYRPLRLGFWMVLAWIFCAAIYWHAALQGVMGPSNPLVFQHPEYATCQKNWYLCEKLPEEYTGFSPLVYSLDVILPLVNLQQENDWAPLIPTPKERWWEELRWHWTWNHFVRLVLWLEILFGWVSSLLLVAVVSGLTKRRED